MSDDCILIGEIENLDLLGELNEGFLVGEIHCGDTLLIAGPQGIQGPAGSTIYTEDGAPSNSLGLDNDFYLNNLTGDYYKKVSGSWESQGNLRGPAGAQGANGNNGTNGTNGVAGANGAQGLSAYQVWLAQGNVGNETVFLASLKGTDGADGSNGTNGLSAYQIWLSQGNTGNETVFLASLIGSDGADGSNGLSAYQVWLAQGNVGNESVYLASLKGEQGISGATAIDDAIVNGVSNRAPSQNVVFDAIVSIYNAIADRLSRLGGVMDGPIDMVGDLLGTGHIILRPQDNAPSVPTSGASVFTDTDERLSWISQNGYVSSFDVSAQSDNRVYELPDQDGPLMVDPMVAIGDLMYRDPSNITSRIGIGSDRSILRVLGGIPQWDAENIGQGFGDGNLGNVTLSGPITLTAPVYYNVLTLEAGAVITTNGYPLYCKVLDLSNAPVGAIRWNGGNGNNSGSQSGGTASVGLVSTVFGGSGGGSGGASGVIGAGVQATAPNNQAPSNGGNGGAGGGSGSGVNGGASARAGATASNRIIFGRLETAFMRGVSLIIGGAGGAGGASGGGDGVSVTNSCGGGGGGAGGGVIAIYANKIITSASTPSGVIRSIGGNGGNGRTAPNAGAGAGGGGGGGAGGYIFIGYNEKEGPVISSLIQAQGGNGGNGGNSVTGTGGAGGAGGNSGYVDMINFGTLTGVHAGGVAGTAGTLQSGTTGGSGGPGGVLNVSL